MSEPIYTVDWTSPHTKNWEDWLKPCVGKDNIIALEVGCHEGRSSRWFCEHILTGKGCRLDCIDAWASYQGAEERFDSNTAGLPIRKIKECSEVGLSKMRLEGNRYSFAYVDGCHIAEKALFDLAFAWTMVCRTGVLIADDYDLFYRRLRYPPRLAIDAWLSCVHESRDGYEFRGGQLAVWKL